jgi:hypothetical protein
LSAAITPHYHYNAAITRRHCRHYYAAFTITPLPLAASHYWLPLISAIATLLPLPLRQAIGHFAITPFHAIYFFTFIDAITPPLMPLRHYYIHYAEAAFATHCAITFATLPPLLITLIDAIISPPFSLLPLPH